MKINLGNALAQGAMFLLTYAVPLFIPGGIRAWPAAWIFLVIWFGFNHGILGWLYMHNPDLLQERLQVEKKNQPSWDKILTLLLYSAIFLWLLFMAFDVVRFHWSPVNSIPSGWWDGTPGVLLLSPFHRISRKHVLIDGRPYPGRAWANRHFHRPVSGCSPPDVCCDDFLFPGGPAFTRFLAWVFLWESW